jgi:hypothetical protein
MSLDDYLNPQPDDRSSHRARRHHPRRGTAPGPGGGGGTHPPEPVKGRLDVEGQGPRAAAGYGGPVARRGVGAGPRVLASFPRGVVPGALIRLRARYRREDRLADAERDIAAMARPDPSPEPSSGMRNVSRE